MTLLLICIGRVIDSITRIPEDYEVITPLDTEAEPATFNSDVPDTFKESVCGNFINGKIGTEYFSERKSEYAAQQYLITFTLERWRAQKFLPSHYHSP